MTDARWNVLNKVHGRLEEMDKKGIDFFDSIDELRDEWKRFKQESKLIKDGQGRDY